MMKKNSTTYTKESDLCTAFIESLPDTWDCYPETGGFDMLLVRKSDGFQIGIEAKLRLNAKVITQIVEHRSPYCLVYPGPDCRAILVPDRTGSELSSVCSFLGITVIRMYDREDNAYRVYKYQPELPDEERSYSSDQWYEFCPTKRIKPPDYVPDVTAGRSSPVALTHWKIKAIKIDITIEKRGYVCREDFKYFSISMSRWTAPGVGWLVKDGKGGWVKGPYIPDFKAQHPVNYKEIEADYDEWKNPETPATQLKLGG